MTLQERASRLAEQQFLGVPVSNFEDAGREQLIYLLRAGLKPQSKLLDLGCGVLRSGYWTIHFLDRDCYCGIEPHTWRLEAGKYTILEPETLEIKRPRFDTNPNFDASVFGEKFDFFLAYSIWTHASKPQVELTLDSFLRHSSDGAAFLVSYIPAGWKHRDYKGDKWHGTSHESNVAGCIAHSSRWISAQCGRRGLEITALSRDTAHGQHWLKIMRAIAE